MLNRVTWTVGVTVIVGSAVEVGVEVGRTAVGGTVVLVGTEVKVTTVAVGDTGVGLDKTGVADTGSVGEGMGEAVGVITIGLPNSLQPRSGAAPVNPAIGAGGIGSPLAAINWVIPLSMAGDVP